MAYIGDIEKEFGAAKRDLLESGALTEKKLEDLLHHTDPAVLRENILEICARTIGEPGKLASLQHQVERYVDLRFRLHAYSRGD